jgi:hypothetical protein
MWGNLPGLLSVPDRFFDRVSASYYVTDDFELSIGHVYTFGRHGLTLGSEYGVALGGGRMASLFAHALFAEGGNNAVLGGVRFYFGQRDKTLIDRHRQDDPLSTLDLDMATTLEAFRLNNLGEPNVAETFLLGCEPCT